MGKNKNKKNRQSKSDPEQIDSETKAQAEELKQKGNELFKAGDFKNALELFNQGLEKDPNSVPLISNRCLSHMKLGNLEQAIADA